jgi:hypothetical protein
MTIHQFTPAPSSAGPARSADEMGAIVELLQPDDAIPCVTGLSLVDLDPKVLARRLRHKSWHERARVMNNLAADSCEWLVKMTELVPDDTEQQQLSEWAMVEYQRAIAMVLHEFGDDAPTEPAAAVLFHLSLDPAHRIRARGWQRECYDGLPVEDLFYDESEHYPVLAMLFQMITLAWPAANEAWRRGAGGMPEVTLAPEPRHPV